MQRVAGRKGTAPPCSESQEEEGAAMSFFVLP
jgi:hypothetical protein